MPTPKQKKAIQPQHGIWYEIQAREIWMVRGNATMSYTLSCARLQLVNSEVSARPVRVAGELGKRKHVALVLEAVPKK